MRRYELCVFVDKKSGSGLDGQIKTLCYALNAQ